jgi:hypothetical protein
MKESSLHHQFTVVMSEIFLKKNPWRVSEVETSKLLSVYYDACTDGRIPAYLCKETIDILRLLIDNKIATKHKSLLPSFTHALDRLYRKTAQGKNKTKILFDKYLPAFRDETTSDPKWEIKDELNASLQKTLFNFPELAPDYLEELDWRTPKDSSILRSEETEMEKVQRFKVLELTSIVVSAAPKEFLRYKIAEHKYNVYVADDKYQKGETKFSAKPYLDYMDNVGREITSHHLHDHTAPLLRGYIPPRHNLDADSILFFCDWHVAFKHMNKPMTNEQREMFVSNIMDNPRRFERTLARKALDTYLHKFPSEIGNMHRSLCERAKFWEEREGCSDSIKRAMPNNVSLASTLIKHASATTPTEILNPSYIKPELLKKPAHKRRLQRLRKKAIRKVERLLAP